MAVSPLSARRLKTDGDQGRVRIDPEGQRPPTGRGIKEAIAAEIPLAAPDRGLLVATARKTTGTRSPPRQT